MSRSTKYSRGVRLAAASALLATTLPAPVFAQNLLNTGKKITLPPLGPTVNVGSLPMNLVATPDGKFALSSDMGFRQKLSAVNAATGALTSSVTLGDPTVGFTADGLYYGIAVRANGDGTYTVYASRGSAAAIGVYALDANGVLTTRPGIAMQHGDFPAGVALSADGRYLYVVDNMFFALTHSSATQAAGDAISNITTPGRFVVYDTTTGAEVGRASISSPFSATTFSSFPLAVATAGTKAYVTSQRDGLVYVFSVADPTNPAVTGTVVTGAASSHPSGLTVNRAGTRVYVAGAHSDTVSVIDTSSDKVVSTVSLRPAAAPDLPGVSPVGLGLSPDGRTLYAALGDLNAVGVIDTASATLQGYIPAGWYPTGVVASTQRRQILVSNGKGVQPRYPNPGYQQFAFNGDPQYDLNQIEGTVETIAVPNPVALQADTQTVLANNRIAPDTDNPANPLVGIGLGAGKIKHVIYIIKENRTYDQVLGDLPQGNGNPALTLFGAAITPNLHALASRFVLLDNFYDCAEASGDGWPWSTQSIANEYVIKNLPYNYSGRGRNYDFEGTNNNYPVAGIPAPTTTPTDPTLLPRDPHGAPIVGAGTPFATGGPAIPDVSEAPGRTAASGGHIWDDALDHGLSIRNYGFFLDAGDTTYTYPGANGQFSYTVTPHNIPDNYPAVKGLSPAGFIAPSADGTGADFSHAGTSDTDFRKYDNAFPDSDAPYNYYQANPNDPLHNNYLYPKTVFGFYNQPSRFSEFNREFQLMLKQGAKDGQADRYVPNFMMVRFHHDHTQGLSSGVHTPRAEVADNDYAVGQLVDAVSKSPVWNSTAIFVIEDDSQDGADHVDVHRSTCYVISPYVKQNSVDHTFYNTDSVLKTMEELLGLPPMSQYDAVATPILDFDTAPSNGAAYTATVPPGSIIGELAPKMSLLSPHDPRRKLLALSATMDFADPDSAPAQLLNEIVWQSVKGVGSRMPAPVHNAKIEARLHLPKAGKAAKNAARDGDD